MVLAGLIIIFLLLVILLFVVLFKPTAGGDTFDYEYFQAQEQQIEKLIASSQPGDQVQALLAADRLLDHFLQARQFAGQSLGERLKLAGYKYPQVRQIWPAHKYRNKIVHESGVSLSRRQMSSFWKDYKKAYKILMR